MIPARVLALPFGIAVLVTLYLVWKTGNSYGNILIPSALILATIFLMQKEINFWWYKRNPPDLDLPLRRFLEDRHPFYKQLSPALKEKFRKRVGLFMYRKEFKPMAMDTKKMPEDLKMLIAVNAIELTLGLEDFLFNSFENFVIYPHPFPSPQHKFIHASELHEEDRVIIFSAELLVPGTLQPRRFFNLGIYEFARAYRLEHPDVDIPELNEAEWPLLKSISGMDEELVKNITGMPVIDLFGTTTVFFFSFPHQFLKQWPEMFHAMKKVWRYNPLEHHVLIELK